MRMPARTLSFALLLALGTADTASAADDATTEAIRARASRRSGSISIDGHLDDEGWAKVAPTNGFVQRFPDAGKAPSQDTEFRVVYDDKALYIGVRCYDAEPGEVRGLLTRRDQPSTSDWVHVGIDSYFDRRTAFMFGVNAAGVQSDRLLFNDSQEDMSWDAVWSSAASVDESGWIAEMRIPLSQLRFSARDRQAWGLQIMRRVGRTGEESVWSPWPRESAQIVSRFGILEEIEGLEPGRRLEVLPYATGGLAIAEVAEDDPFHSSTEGRYGAGIDVKYGLTSAFTLATTLNPDFGQVEADPSEVNLTAQETFFPEKRPFFLEGSEFFRLGLGTNLNNAEGLFYTRRIGAPPSLHGNDYAQYSDTPRETTIYGAAKVSGKTQGGLAIGLLDAVTAEETAELEGGAAPRMSVQPLTNYALARVAKDLRNGDTMIAGVATAVNRKLDGAELESLLHDQAYTGGLDLFHRFGKDEYSTTIHMFGSHVRGSPEAIFETQTHPRHLYQRPDATHLELDGTRTSLSGVGAAWDVGRWNHKHWNFGTGGDFRTPGVETNDMGFQHYSDFIGQWAWTGWQDNEPSPQVLNWGIGSDVWYGSDLEPRISNVGQSLNAWVTLANHWGLSGGGNYNHNRWDRGALRGGPRLNAEDGMNVFANLNTDSRKKVWLALWANGNRRQESDTWSSGIGGTLTIQARSNLEIVVGPSLFVGNEDHQYVDTVVDDAGAPHYVFARIHQVVTAMTLRTSWTFTPRLSLQLYAQPFIASGAYKEFKEAADTYSNDYDERFDEFGRNEMMEVDGVIQVDRDGDGIADIGFDRPDFNFRALTTNLVARWEYRPGSTVFLIWSHGRSSDEPDGRYRAGHDLSQLADEAGEHVVMIKANYWVGL
jgi:hypothetical protein